MGLLYHPKQGALVLVRFDKSFKEPEMVKPRPCVVVSKGFKSRPNLMTVVPLSTTPPEPVMPWHCEIEIGLELPPRWSRKSCWVKGDMIYAVGFHRADLFQIARGADGRRVYQNDTISTESLERIQKCILEGLALSHLTKHV
ncbi:MAG: hypothetical protein RL216_2594 [Pseudomonadota bacterium]|jgi:uncharacterized protein YifN (PemK superfamily)